MADPQQAPTDGARLATPDDIRHVLGDIDDVAAVAILSLGPSFAELTEAALWARGDGDLAAREHKELSGASLAIARILEEIDEAAAAEDS